MSASNYFTIIPPMSNVQTIASGRGVDIRNHLNKRYGPGNWRKMKGHAWVRLEDATLVRAEIHWYEAHGIGQMGHKIKHWL